MLQFPGGLEDGLYVVSPEYFSYSVCDFGDIFQESFSLCVNCGFHCGLTVLSSNSFNFFKCVAFFQKSCLGVL